MVTTTEHDIVGTRGGILLLGWNDNLEGSADIVAQEKIDNRKDDRARGELDAFVSGEILAGSWLRFKKTPFTHQLSDLMPRPHIITG